MSHNPIALTNYGMVRVILNTLDDGIENVQCASFFPLQKGLAYLALNTF